MKDTNYEVLLSAFLSRFYSFTFPAPCSQTPSISIRLLQQELSFHTGSRRGGKSSLITPLINLP
jgi:hypothetical protein